MADDGCGFHDTQGVEKETCSILLEYTGQILLCISAVEFFPDLEGGQRLISLSIRPLHPCIYEDLRQNFRLEVAAPI